MVSSLSKVFRRESSSSHEDVLLREANPEDQHKRRSSFFRRFSLGRKSSIFTSPKSDSEDESQQKIELLLTEIKMLENSNQKYYKLAKRETETRLAAENELLKVRVDIDKIEEEHRELRRQVRILKMMMEFDDKKRDFLQRKRFIPKSLSKEWHQKIRPLRIEFSRRALESEINLFYSLGWTNRRLFVVSASFVAPSSYSVDSRVTVVISCSGLDSEMQNEDKCMQKSPN